MAVLVTGGAGYIGSVVVEALRERGEDVVVLDNLSRGHRAAVARLVPFYLGDVGDAALVARIARTHALEACLHFAAFAYVGESMTAPSLYFGNNVAQGVSFLDTLVKAGVRRLVFSSSCATYGDPGAGALKEDTPQWPSNPYGWTKFVMERMLETYDRAYGLRSVALRYFNAAGATATRGEDHALETHLIPNVLAAARGTAPGVVIYGRDHPTPDGTAIRDFVHVSDLAEAHLLALDHLRAGRASEQINLGNGKGASVLEVLEVARRVTGRPIPARFMGARAGDPPCLVADASRAHTVLGWRPLRPDLGTIVETAWTWHLANPDGYPGTRV
ncbi:MAG TPA: UDP-glucose 4-epimerase GalE [Verrucomicrobiae bacterium]|jgi:UDP-glucose 4-epimerase|nr:UDP-glucose 4-epimerase GalE [Verrucomicrobiae bacterium]